MRKIKVLVVEDSAVFREMLVKGLEEDAGIEVVAQAENPFEARDAIEQFQPDVMTLDIEMPKMSGIDFLKKLMPQYPLPVIMLSGLNGKVFEAMAAGVHPSGTGSETENCRFGGCWETDAQGQGASGQGGEADQK